MFIACRCSDCSLRTKEIDNDEEGIQEYDDIDFVVQEEVPIKMKMLK